jgi:hypothetical protein
MFAIDIVWCFDLAGLAAILNTFPGDSASFAAQSMQIVA